MSVQRAWNEQWRALKPEHVLLDGRAAAKAARYLGWFTLGLGLAALAVIGISALDVYRDQKPYRA